MWLGVMVLAAGTIPARGVVLTSDAQTEILYHFDEGTGTNVADSSSHNRGGVVSATLAADPGEWIPGDAGHGNAIHQDSPTAPGQFRAVSWNNAGNALDLGAMDEFTVQMRFNATQWSNHDPFFTIGNGFGLIRLQAPDTVPPLTTINELQVVYANPGANTATIALSTSIVAGTWYDIAVVYRDHAVSDPLNDNLQIWLDGELIGSASTVGDIAGASAADVVVGQSVGGIWYNQFQGDYDEFRIQSEAVFSIEQPPVPPLTADADTTVLYHFDEGAGTNVLDASGNNRTGTFNTDLIADGPSAWIDGQAGLGGAVFYDDPLPAENRWIRHTGTDMGLLSADAFTVQMRIKPVRFTADNYLATFGTGAGHFNIRTWTNTVPLSTIPVLTINLWNPSIDTIEIPLDPPLVAGLWQELAIVSRDNSVATASNENIQVWIDGVLAGSVDIGDDLATLDSSVFTVGHGPGAPWWPLQYQGGIDEFRVSTKAVYAAPEPPVIPETPLTADANTRVLYHFDEGAGTTVLDASSNNRTGTFNAALAADGASAWVAGQAGLSNAVFYADPTPTETRWIRHTGTDMGLVSASAFTVQMRVKPVRFTANYFFANFGPDAGHFNIRGWTNTSALSSIPALTIDLWNPSLNTIEIPLNPPLVAGEWQELAVVVRDDAVTTASDEHIQVWIDGVLAGSVVTSGDVITLDSSVFTVGQGPSDTPYWPQQFQGDIDEFRVQAEAVYGVAPVIPIKIVGLDVTPAEAIITWESVSNGSYRVDRATNLLDGFTEAVATNLPGVLGLTTYTDAVSGVEGASYRIQGD